MASVPAPIEYFRFSEGTGSTSTGREGETLTINGDFAWGSPLVLESGTIDSDQAASQGCGIEFDDSGFLDFTTTSSFSISLWFEETREGSRNDLPNYLISQKAPTSSSDFGSWRIATSSSTLYPVTDSVLFELRHGSPAVVERLSAPRSLNTVHNVVCVYDADSNEAKLYLDGVLEDSATGLNALETQSSTSASMLGDVVNESLTMLGRIGEVAIFDVALSSQNVVSIYNSGDGLEFGSPPTPEQQFNSSYADVSGRDPLPTALTQRTPAQQLVNYLVSLYAGTNPRIVEKPVQIEQGELGKTSPAPASGDLSRQIWIEDDRDPNFKGGRWATILGRSGGSEPGTVTLTLFIADNDESFVEPT